MINAVKICDYFLNLSIKIFNRNFKFSMFSSKNYVAIFLFVCCRCLKLSINNVIVFFYLSFFAQNKNLMNCTTSLLSFQNYRQSYTKFWNKFYTLRKGYWCSHNRARQNYLQLAFFSRWRYCENGQRNRSCLSPQYILELAVERAQ